MKEGLNNAQTLKQPRGGFSDGLVRPWKLPRLLARDAFDGGEFDALSEQDHTRARGHRLARRIGMHDGQAAHEYATALRDAIEAISTDWARDGSRPSAGARSKATPCFPSVPLEDEVPQYFDDRAIAMAPH
eukprot:gene11344-21949_t